LNRSGRGLKFRRRIASVFNRPLFVPIFELIVHAIPPDLADDQRHVIPLHFLEEFSLCETAAISGKDISLVKVIQSRAIAMLRNVFTRHEIQSAVSLPDDEKLYEVWYSQSRLTKSSFCTRTLRAWTSRTPP